MDEAEKDISKAFIEWATSVDPNNIQPFDPTKFIEMIVSAEGQMYAFRMASKYDSTYKFNMVKPKSVQWARQFAAQEIKEINGPIRKTIQSITIRGLQEGLSVREQSRLIKQQIGLLPNQVKAVENYTRKLAETGVPKERIAQLEQKYVNKLLKYRADTIAINENVTATSNSQRIINEDLVNRGIIKASEYETTWYATPDERMCPICGALHGTTAPIGGTFAGGYTSPPAHVRCRCVIYITKKK